MKVTIVGCGNAGLIHAAKIFEKGDNETCLLKTCNTNSEYFNKIVNDGARYLGDWEDYNG